MLDQWAADVFGKMHQHKITSMQLARALGWNPKYLSTVLNGHKKPKNAATKIRTALDELIAAKAGKEIPEETSA